MEPTLIPDQEKGSWMASFDIRTCQMHDRFPLEISPEEIGSLAGPVNTLLRSSYLIGGSFNFEETFHSVFDIRDRDRGSRGVRPVPPGENAIGTWELKWAAGFPIPSQDRLPDLLAPAAIAANFGKAISWISMPALGRPPSAIAWNCRSLLTFPLHKDRDVAGALVFGKREPRSFSNVQVKLLCALSMQAKTSAPVRLDQDHNFYSFIDPLTHLYNRHFFDNQLEKEILRSRRSGEAFSLLEFDLDGFTEYNDRFLIRPETSCCRNSPTSFGMHARGGHLARVGGDEFSVILLNSDVEGAQALATRVVERFQRHLLPGTRMPERTDVGQRRHRVLPVRFLRLHRPG